MTCLGVVIVSDEGGSDEHRCALPAGHRQPCEDDRGVWLSTIEELAAFPRRWIEPLPPLPPWVIR